MTPSLSSTNSILLHTLPNEMGLVTIGLGWKVAAKPRSWIQRLFGPDEEGFDLDAMAVLLDANDKIRNFGGERDLGGGRRVGLVDSDVVFYNNLQHPSMTIWHTGDDLKGGTGGDNEQMIVKLKEIPAVYHKVLFIVTIHQGLLRGQHFGMVRNAYIRAVDAKGKEIARFNLSNTNDYEGKCTMVFAEIIRREEAWEFHGVGDAYTSDSFVEVLRKHV